MVGDFAFDFTYHDLMEWSEVGCAVLKKIFRTSPHIPSVQFKAPKIGSGTPVKMRQWVAVVLLMAKMTIATQCCGESWPSG